MKKVIKTNWVHLRVTEEMKLIIKQLAEKENIKVSVLFHNLLNEKINKEAK